MKWDNSTAQKDFFDIPKYQYPENKIIHPPPAQMFEFLHFLQVANISKNETILEFGSGSGRLTIPMLKAGYNVLAVDISHNSLSTLEMVYNRYKTKLWGKLSTSETIPKGKRFSTIIGSDILHHVPIVDYMPKLYRHLNHNGQLVICEPNAWHLPWYLFYMLLHPSWEIESGITQCSIPKLHAICKKAGFREIYFEGHGLIPTLLLNHVPRLCRLNALKWGNIGFLKYIAFRILLRARK